MRRLVSLLAIAACSSEVKVAARDTTPVQVAPPPAEWDSLAVCPATGQWAVCSVMYRLKRAGFLAVRDTAPAREKHLDQIGMSLALARGEMKVFIYPDSANRRRDAADLDSVDFIRADGFPNPNKRTILESANLLVLMAVYNERSRERIIDALTAGPPMAAPDSTKR